MLELQFRVTILELLGTLITVLEQKKINEEISSPHLLNIFFLSKRRLINQLSLTEKEAFQHMWA